MSVRYIVIVRMRARELPARSKKPSIWCSTLRVCSTIPPATLWSSGTCPARYTTPLWITISEKRFVVS
jgi:type IV pilus biogenesis protein CpaD/CtpE